MDIEIGTEVHLCLGLWCVPARVTGVVGYHVSLDYEADVAPPAGMSLFGYEPYYRVFWSWHQVHGCPARHPGRRGQLRPVRDLPLL